MKTANLTYTTIKKRLLVLFFCLMPLFAAAQVTRQHHAARAGDKIVKQQVRFMDPGGVGEDQLWDLSGLKAEGKEYIVEYFTPPSHKDSAYIVMGCDTFPKKDIQAGELLVGLEHYTAYYYRILNDRVMLLGFENPVNLMHYKEPMLVMSYPLTRDGKVNKDYRGQVIYSGQHPLDIYGTQTVEADASGRMILPSGDTLQHVVRVRTVQTIADNALTRKQASQALSTVMETCRWFVQGYRYPVFETIRSLDASKSQKETTFQTAFFYEPEAHYYLEEDPQNQLVQASFKIQTRSGGGADGVRLPDNWPLKGTHWGANFYPNPVESRLYVDYMIDTEKEVALMLYDTAGRLLKHVPAGDKRAGSYEEIIDCHSLPTGSYILRIQVGNEGKSKIIIKK